MTDSSPEVWLFYPKERGHSIREAIRLKCKELGWTYAERPTSKFRLSQGRSIQRMNPEDATNLYRRIHTRRVGVWQVSDADVPVRPNPSDSPRHYVPLRRFVRYKAFHYRIDPNGFREHWEDSATAFKSWIDTIGCEGEGDARCLPFHVFGTDLDKYDLGTPDGRQRFERDHRWRNSRRDENGLLWNRPPAQQMHGQPILQVASRDLVQGFHWDVTASRRRSKSWTVANTSEVWKINHKGHVNISSNAHIRGSKDASRIH